MKNEFKVDDSGRKSLESDEIKIDGKEIIIEKWYFKFLQIVIPFFIAGFGMVGAGILFSVVEVWKLLSNLN